MITRINDVDYDGKYISIYMLCNYDYTSVNECLYCIIYKWRSRVFIALKEEFLATLKKGKAAGC